MSVHCWSGPLLWRLCHDECGCCSPHGRRFCKEQQGVCYQGLRVEQPWGEQTLLLLSSEAQQQFKNTNPSSQEVQVLWNSSFCSLVVWLRLVCQETDICPSTTLHFHYVLCFFGYTVLLEIYGTKPATCNHILLMLHGTVLEVLCGLSVPFFLMSFGEGLELTYLLRPLGRVHSSLLCTLDLQERPAFS